jgi:DNA helicase HerA-like ATPase
MACIRELRNCLLVIDELSLYCPTENLRSQENKALETLILQGRRYGIRMAVACQRLNRIPGEFHSEATEIVVFHTSRPRDLKVLDEWGLVDAEEVAPSLGVGECVVLRH